MSPTKDVQPSVTRSCPALAGSWTRRNCHADLNLFRKHMPLNEPRQKERAEDQQFETLGLWMSSSRRGWPRPPRPRSCGSHRAGRTSDFRSRPSPGLALLWRANLPRAACLWTTPQRRWRMTRGPGQSRSSRSPARSCAGHCLRGSLGHPAKPHPGRRVMRRGSVLDGSRSVHAD